MQEDTRHQILSFEYAQNSSVESQSRRGRFRGPGAAEISQGVRGAIANDQQRHEFVATPPER
jgi:hypothetical protein